MGLTEQHSEYAALSDVELVELALADLAQEAFVRAHRALPGFRGQAQVRSWLYRIATNLALNAVQRRREYPTDALPDRPARRDPALDTERAAMGRELEEAISELPDKLKEPLVLREYEGMSYQDIADLLDLPINTVRTRILRGRRALRERMEAWR